MSPPPFLAGIAAFNVITWAGIAGLNPSRIAPWWVELPLNLIFGAYVAAIIWTNRERVA